MPASHELTEEALIAQAHELRRRALQGDARATALAREYEIELRGRLKNRRCAETPDGASDSEASPPDASRCRVATADTASDAVTRALSELLRNARELLEMDIAFVSEFSQGQRIFRHVDADPAQPARLQVGQSDPLEETYCQRVVDGRLPWAIPDAQALPETEGLAVTRSLNIGAYLSAPVVLANGEIYGTLCCISHQARSALGSRQIDAIRTVAALVSSEIEKNRRAATRH